MNPETVPSSSASFARIPTGEHFAMMMRKDHPLLEEVNQAISDMKSDGTMATIHEKRFGVPPEPGSSTVTPGPVPTAS